MAKLENNRMNFVRVSIHFEGIPKKRQPSSFAERFRRLKEKAYKWDQHCHLERTLLGASSCNLSRSHTVSIDLPDSEETAQNKMPFKIEFLSKILE